MPEQQRQVREPEGGQRERPDSGLHILGQQRLDFLKALLSARALFGDGKHLGFRFVEQLAHLAALGGKCRRGDIVGHGHQLAQHRTLPHDLRIAADIGRARRILRQRVQIGQATDFLGLAGHLQHLVDRNHVRRLGGGDQARNALEDQTVVEAIEIRFRQEIGNAVPGGVVQQQATEHRLLGLDRMRRNLETVELGVGGGRVHGMGL